MSAIDAPSGTLLKPSRLKWISLLMVGIVFVLAGIWIAPQKPNIGYPAIAFFGIGVVVAAINLHPRSSYLLLDTSGLTYASLFRKHFVPWNEIASFVPIRIGMKQMVGWNYRPTHEGSSKLRSFNVSLSGAEAALPDTYGRSVTQLIELLEDFRSRS